MKNIINSMPPISLKKMKNVELLKRTDTKFILNTKEFLPILKEIRNSYRVLEIDQNRIMTYQTCYFDTKKKQFYHDHHNGRTRREKIRIRKYMESQRCFLEIKQKDGKGKTTKTRTTTVAENELTKQSLEFIKKTTQRDFDLLPTIQNQFNRITLVNNTSKERVTIDLNLKVYTDDTSERIFKDLVIIEVKQELFDRNSPVISTLKRYGNHPFRISKYCIGMVSMYNNLKYNKFKRKFLKIDKIGA